MTHTKFLIFFFFEMNHIRMYTMKILQRYCLSYREEKERERERGKEIKIRMETEIEYPPIASTTDNGENRIVKAENDHTSNKCREKEREREKKRASRTLFATSRFSSVNRVRARARFTSSLCSNFTYSAFFARNSTSYHHQRKKRNKRQ